MRMRAAKRVALLAPSFSPRSIPGLIRAWRPDQPGITTDANGITRVEGAWGCTDPLTASGTTEPDLAAAIGPGGQDMFQFTRARNERFDFLTTPTMTNCTFVWVYSPNDQSAISTIFGHPSNLCYLRQNNSGGSTVVTFQVFPLGGANVNIALTGNVINKYAQIMAVTYRDDGLTSVYVDNKLSGSATAGLGGFAINRLGVGGTVNNPWQGYMGPVLIYNRVLTLDEISRLNDYLAPWRSSRYYVANAGSDTSLTPWLQSTPLQTLETAIALNLHGNDTLAFKGGDIFRPTGNRFSTLAGTSPSKPNTLDGGLWGTGKAQFRSSTAVVLTNTAGFIYSAPVATEPTHFVHYLPGGVIAFATVAGNPYDLGNMKRLTKTAGVQTTPGVGEWGYAAATLYVNAGVVLATGDIEVPDTGSNHQLTVGTNNWTYKNYITAYSTGVGLGVFPGTNLTGLVVQGVEAYFNDDDGLNAFGNADITYQDCISAWNGQGDLGAGFSAGDGFSVHATVTARFLNCKAYWNGKDSFAHQDGTVTYHDRCVGVGAGGARTIADVGGGSMSVVNSYFDVKAGAIINSGIENASTTVTLTAKNNTIISRGAASSGLFQSGAGGTLIAQNNIVQGFDKGISKPGTGTVTADHNLYYNNTTTYSGVAAGAGDITATDPLFTDPTNFDVSLQAGSPAKAAGSFNAAIAVDLIDRTRTNPPSIGARD